jgi:hypothetical protein
VGGGTGWLAIHWNVQPGETIELRFVVWDTGDALYDSVVVLDQFEWSLASTAPGASASFAPPVALFRSRPSSQRPPIFAGLNRARSAVPQRAGVPPVRGR